MKKLMIAIAALAATVQVLAMPTRAELSKAQPLVAELMAPALEEYKSAADKTAAAVKVGDSSSAFAAEAETEAAKFLLLKGAVNYYVRGEAYDKAADCIATMQSDISNLTPDAIAEIVGKATGRISESKAPRLIAYYRAAKLQIRARKELPVLEKKLKRVKTEQLQRQYAEALAISGNWKAAYDAFAKSSNANLAQIAEVFPISAADALDAAHADRLTIGPDTPDRIIIPCRKADEPGLLRVPGDDRRIRQETDLRIVQPKEGTLQENPVERNQDDLVTAGRHASTKPCSPDSP